MKTRTLMIGGLLMLVILFGAIALAGADRGSRNKNYRNDNYEKRGYVLDRRYNHNRHYPKPGLLFKDLPRGSRFSPYRRHRYYYNEGVWYLPSSSGFTVVIPPYGLTVPVLPPFYTTIWVGGVPYYYADDVYYRWRPEDRVYVVAEPPAEIEVIEQSSLQEEIFIYPKEGQSEGQQATDRYECHRWAITQTGFDPTQPGGNVPAEQHAAKRLEYQRAMKACLEARNYSVQ
jgi:hypothetical protein